MTVDDIERVEALINEMESDGMLVGSAWEYTNKMNNTVMFAVFPASQYCDIHESPAVSEAVLIWYMGQYRGKYAYLNG